MAWNLKPDYASKSGSLTRKTRTYRLGYVVTGVGAGATPLGLLTFAGLSRGLTAWGDDPAAILQEASAEQDTEDVWRIDAKFSTQTKDPKDDDKDPLRRPPKRSSSFIQRDTFPHKDIKGKVVANTAGQRFTSFSIPETIKVLTIQRNEGTHNFLDSRYENKTNSGRFYGRAKGNALMMPTSATEEWDTDYGAYASVTYVIHFMPPGKTWVAEFVDAGRYYVITLERDFFLLPDGGDSRQIMLPSDNEEVKFSDEVALNGEDGGLLPQAAVDAGNFKTLKFDRYEEANFGGLNLEW